MRRGIIGFAVLSLLVLGWAPAPRLESAPGLRVAPGRPDVALSQVVKFSPRPRR